MVSGGIYREKGKTHFYKEILFNNLDFKQIMMCVKPKYTEEKQKEKLLKRFSSVADSGFETDILEDIVKSTPEPAFWRIGEYIGMCYLEDQNLARFPYVNNDKNPDAYNTGSDLLGFSTSNNESIFLIGEIKTSYDKKSPPSVVYGDGGMIKQLEKTICNDRKQKTSIRWIMNNVDVDTDQINIDMFTSALKNYIKLKKIKIVGMLIRDTDPKKTDLQSTCNTLKNIIKPPSSLNLFSIYTPVQIQSFESHVT